MPLLLCYSRTGLKNILQQITAGKAKNILKNYLESVARSREKSLKTAEVVTITFALAHWLVLEEEAGMVTAWVDGKAMVDTAWQEVMTVKEAETVSVLA